MKKILAILISVLLLLNTTAIIFAEEDITIDVQFNEETKEFTISGYIKYERDRIPVALYMTHEDGNTVSITETIATGIEEEGIPYTFSNIKLKNSTRTGDISIRVATGELDFVNETSYHYLGIDRQFTALITLKSAIESGNYDTLKSAILSTKSELGIDDTLFLNLLSEKSPYIAMNNLFGLTIAQIEGWNIDNLTDEQCAKIEEQVKLYQKQYKEAVQLGEFFDCTTVAELKAWYDANKTEYGFLLDNGETAVDERKLIDYFDQAVLVEAFTQRKQNIEFVKTMKELNLEMKKQAVLQIVADSNQSEILNIISNLSVLLSNVYDANGQNPVSVNYTDWNSLSSNQKTAVCINIAGNSYRDIYEFVSAVNTQISLNKGTVVTGTPDRGESTGGRGGKGNSDVFMPLPDTNEVTNSVLSFKDIENVKWAEDAISYLYSLNVISGRNSDTFAPDEHVTRAELVKMLVLGFGLEGNGSVSFGDVSNNAWYAQYVSIAAENGLINGDENGNFNPNKAVSRQDAAVMMYRAIGKDAKTDKAYFVDYEKISTYAQDAVNYMCANRIINGMGNGVFAPLDNLTRAQSAKMVYGLLVH